MIADEDDNLFTVRRNDGDINWGRSRANTRLNPDISNVTNKRVMRTLFKRSGVPMPHLLSEESALATVLEGGIVVGRPDRHSKGRGLWKCHNVTEVMRAMRGTRKKKAATHFMEFINAPYEYRVHIFMGKSIRISEKAHGLSGTTAHGDYITVKPTHNIKHVREAAKQAVKAVGLDFGAVDVLANETECWVLEVNAAPGLGGTMPALYARVFKQYMEGLW